jgi:hypothetical protein
VTDTATAAFADKAYLFFDQAGAFPYKSTPYVAPGSLIPARVGDTTVSGSPMGGRQIAEDVAPREHQNPPATQEAATKPNAWCFQLLVRNDGPAALEISFDGVKIDGYIPSGAERVYERHEAGIAVRGAGAVFRIEAW